MIAFMIKRDIQIKELVTHNKVLIVYGPRQVGKTTLIEQYIDSYKKPYIYRTGDDIPFADEISKCDLRQLESKIPPNTLLVIDEAQKISNIGQALKLIVDKIDGVSVIATGSSSFDLLSETGEALTGRKNVVTLFPITVHEAINYFGAYDLPRYLDSFLIYGMYPSVLSSETNSEKADIIKEITHSYLLKDILDFDKVKNSKKIFDLLRLLAFQVGSQVSTSELATHIGVDKNTVANYLDLLEKSFVLFRLDGFSRNLRKEVSKMSKYYFYDLGIRNALIANFNDLEIRNDQGQLWENFILMERIKHNAYHNVVVNYYFWRTYDHKEIDLIEERGGRLHGYEFKWKQSIVKAPKNWLETYANADYVVYTPQNYLDFII